MLQITFYNQTEQELGIIFSKTPKQYIYPGVGPYHYNKIRLYLSKRNWRKAILILNQHGKRKPSAAKEIMEKLNGQRN